MTKDPKWQALIDNPDLATDDSWYGLCTTGHDLWSVQVFLDLRRSGLNIYLVSKPVPGQICVIPYYYLTPRDWLFKSYVVACRYDTPRPILCNHRTVMNHGQIKGKTDHYLPHRPQPSLQPRQLSRGSTVENLVFKGHSYNLAEPFRTPEFLQALQSLGVRLVMSTENATAAFSEWADYTQADVVIAVRNNTLYDIALKPALKLVNAWFAGCPAILGPEPAYQAIRQSELDYFEVRTPEEAIAALQTLKDNPKLYRAMVENGFRRARDYTVDRVNLEWRNLLAGEIATGYEQWLKASTFQQKVVRPVLYSWQILEQRRELKQYRHNIEHGKRVLDPA
ncbi:MAG: glycosyltransferase [Leptolyngbyaceae cyanobacterium bins.302]|nr:glycosyltransferase [Leptolyngbyaceae cyanobacterium bins.302]